MSIRKNTWDLDGHYDLTNSGLNGYVGQNELYVLGGAGFGQLGLNDVIPRSSPVQVPGTQWSQIQSSDSNIVASKTDGTLWAWGKNEYGQLGQNNTTYYSSPVQIPGTQWNIFDISQIASSHLLATKTDGTLWTWGAGGIGQGGQNNLISYSSPVQIAGTQWSYGSVSHVRSLALKSDGTLWSFGYGPGGSLGLNDEISRSSPVQIPGTQWSKIARGYVEAIALKTDGTLWVWGNNTYGALGQNDKVPRSSPVQVPGTGWTNEFASSSYSFMAIKDDGTLWTWGINQVGALGLNDVQSRSSPIQLPGTQWSRVSNDGPRSGAGAIKTDGTLWVWGYNSNGHQGQNDRIPRSSPVQIPGTQWSILSSAGSVGAIKQA